MDKQTFLTRVDGHGYANYSDWPDIADDLTPGDRAIIANLPHGSGINYAWHVDLAYDDDGNTEEIRCSNSYHAMDGAGFYRCSIGFDVTWAPGDFEHFTLESEADYDRCTAQEEMCIECKQRNDFSADDCDFCEGTCSACYDLDDYLHETIGMASYWANKDKVPVTA